MNFGIESAYPKGTGSTFSKIQVRVGVRFVKYATLNKHGKRLEFLAAIYSQLKLNKDTDTGFFGKFCEVFKNTYVVEHFRETASELYSKPEAILKQKTFNKQHPSKYIYIFSVTRFFCWFKKQTLYSSTTFFIIF